MARTAMIIDMNRCVGCGACVIACQEEWDLPEGVARNWVRPLYPRSGAEAPVFTHDVGLCNHCRQAPCLGACPTGATYRDEHGRVVVDEQACIGCGFCADACPYGARTVREDRGRVEKCDFCAPLVDSGLEPACVTACPAGARVFGDLDDRDSAVARYFRRCEVRRNVSERVDTEPQVFYSGREEVIARIFAEHPPDADAVEPGAPGRILGEVLRPGFLGLLGIAVTGQLAALARQLVTRESRDTVEASESAAGPMLVRHDTAIILLHWFSALVWLLQAVTGAGLLASSGYRVTPDFLNRLVLATFGSAAALLDFHIAVGSIWLAVLLFFGVFGFRRYLAPSLRHLRIDRTDLTWLRGKLRQLLLRSEGRLPPQGKYNAGQKLYGWVIAVSTAVVVASGLLMVFLPGSGAPVRWSIPAHFAAVAVAVVASSIHAFMAAVVPSERPLLLSMLHGRIPERYAREHNRHWWDEVCGKPRAG